MSWCTINTTDSVTGYLKNIPLPASLHDPTWREQVIPLQPPRKYYSPPRPWLIPGTSTLVPHLSISPASGNCTHLHADPTATAILVTRGRKLVVIIDPDVASALPASDLAAVNCILCHRVADLLKTTVSPAATASGILGWLWAGLSSFGGSGHATPKQGVQRVPWPLRWCVLEPGDVLALPAGFFYFDASATFCCSVSFRLHTTPERTRALPKAEPTTEPTATTTATTTTTTPHTFASGRSGAQSIAANFRARMKELRLCFG